MEELINEIMAMCKGSFSIEVNPQKDYHGSVKKHLEFISDTNKGLLDDIGEDVVAEMIERETLIGLTAYPKTPIGFYEVYHYDLKTALQLIADAIKQ